MEKIYSIVEGIYLEYSADNCWRIYFLGELHDLDKNDIRVILSLLPFLEIGREKVLGKIKNDRQRDLFPEELIVESAFIQGTESWISLAVEWLAGMPNYDENLFREYFESILNNKYYRQKLRHSILRLMKKKTVNKSI